MQDIPIYTPTKLTVLNYPLRRNDVPVQLLEWKLGHMIINAAVCVVLLFVSKTHYSLISLLQITQFFIQILNLRSGEWGTREGWVYCNVDEMVKSGQNSIRLISTAITESLIAVLIQGRFSAAACLFLYRLDGVRRVYEMGDPTEQSKISKDLESLHASQPVKDPVIGIDLILPVLYAILWFQSPMFLIHFGLRAACVVCRDFSIISPIQEELYSDIITTISLNIVIVFITLFY